MAADDLLEARTGSFPPFDEVDALPRGTTVGRYVIIDVIGHGGMGVVYSAIDTQLGRKLAIKFVRDDRDKTTPINASRLLREAHALARLSHRNVVSIYDVGTYEDRVFLVMEYVEGQTLSTWLQTNPPWQARMSALLAAGEGLASAHEAAVIHRDFKPDNVLIGTDGRVVVMDFGLAREAEQEDALMVGEGIPSLAPSSLLPSLPPSMPPLSGPRRGVIAVSMRSDGPELSAALSDPPSGQSFRAPLTLAGKILGTVGFMAPEQAYGRATSVATDQFSYCVTAYFALYGRLPFEGDTVGKYLKSIYRRKLEPPPGSKVPTRVWKILVKGMSRKPLERYPSMRDLLGALRDDRRKTYWGWTAVGAAVVGAAALSALGSRLVDERRNVCSADPKEWVGIWDDPTKLEARKAFAAVDPERGASTFDSATRPIDAYVAQWNTMRAEACSSARLEQRQPESIYRLRSDCLARRKMQLGSVTRLLRQADRDVVEKGPSLGYGLDLISWCGDVEALRASAGLPDDPKKRSNVLDVQSKLADAQAKYVAGKAREALALAADAVTLARTTDHAETTAEALLGHAGLLGELDRDVEATPLLREAFFLASGAGADAVVVRAAAELAYLAGYKPQQVEEARTWLETARAALKRMGGSTELELEVMDAEAHIVSAAEGHPDLALGLSEKAVGGYRKLYGAHQKTLDAIFALGTQHLGLGDPAHARPVLEEASAMADLIGGASWQDTAVVKARLGWTLITLGEFDAGEAAVRSALPVMEHATLEFRQADAYQSLAWLSLAKGKIADAVANGEKSMAHHTSAPGSSMLSWRARTALGLALTRAGRPNEALPLCDKAVSTLEDGKLIYPDKPFGWDALRCEAEALIGLGRSTEAIAYLQRSLTLKRRMFPGDYARAEFTLARALVASHRDAARALELARAAREELARYPFLSFELQEIDAWIAKRGRPG